MDKPFNYEHPANCCRCGRSFLASANTTVYVSPIDPTNEYHYLCPLCQETLTTKQVNEWLHAHVTPNPLWGVDVQGPPN